MSFSYGKVESQVSNLLGTIVGATISTTDTNYAATTSTSNRNNPDFPLKAVEDEIVNAISDIVLTIAETPRHPERNTYRGITAALANLSLVPPTSDVAVPFIGVKGRVYDSGNNKTLLPMPLGKVRSFNEFSGNVYSGFQPYWYAYSGQAIEHTRTNVIIEGCVWARPTFVTANPV